MKRIYMKARLIPAVLLIIFPAVVTAVSAASAQAAGSPERLPLAAGICVNKAQALFQEGRVQEAIDTLEAFLRRPGSEKRSPHPYLPFLLGNFYSSLSQGSSHENALALEKAAQWYRTALEVNPLFYEAWLNLARCCYEAENFQEAALAFEKSYGCSRPGNPIHLYYAAVCRFQAQNSEKALALFNILLKDHPDAVTLTWREMLVNILFSLERFKAALPHIRELAQKSLPPKQKKWQEILLHQYISLGMDTAALSYAGELIRTDPLEPKWWKGVCHIHLENNNIAKGLSALVIYGYLTPMTPEELTLAADLYLSLDIPGRAAALYQDTLEKGSSPKTVEKLARAFAMAHDPDNAVRWIDKGLAALPETPESGKRAAALGTLKKQLMHMQQFYTTASNILNPEQQTSSP